MIDILKLVTALTLISLGAGFAIGITNEKTEEKIIQQKTAKENSALKSVLPAESEILECSGTGIMPEKYWIAKSGEDTIGYAFKTQTRGYSSTIKVMTGTDTSGLITGITILSQSETPGLGTRMEETISKRFIWNGLFKKKEKSQPWFTAQFEGINALERINIDKSREWHKMNHSQKNNLQQENNISAITGATISTKAVVTAVSKSIPGYMESISKQKISQ